VKTKIIDAESGCPRWQHPVVGDRGLNELGMFTSEGMQVVRPYQS
jgi:hypothetical protein